MIGGGTTTLKKNLKVGIPKVKVLGNYSKSNHEASRVLDIDVIAPTFKENHGTINAVAIKNNNSKGYSLAEAGDGIDISGRMIHHRGVVQKGKAHTINTMGGRTRV